MDLSVFTFSCSVLWTLRNSKILCPTGVRNLCTSWARGAALYLTSSDVWKTHAKPSALKEDRHALETFSTANALRQTGGLQRNGFRIQNNVLHDNEFNPALMRKSLFLWLFWGHTCGELEQATTKTFCGTRAQNQLAARLAILYLVYWMLTCC